MADTVSKDVVKTSIEALVNLNRLVVKLRVEQKKKKNVP